MYNKDILKQQLEMAKLIQDHFKRLRPFAVESTAQIAREMIKCGSTLQEHVDRMYPHYVLSTEQMVRELIPSRSNIYDTVEQALTLKQTFEKQLEALAPNFSEMAIQATQNLATMHSSWAQAAIPFSDFEDRLYGELNGAFVEYSNSIQSHLQLIKSTQLDHLHFFNSLKSDSQRFFRDALDDFTSHSQAFIEGIDDLDGIAEKPSWILPLTASNVESTSRLLTYEFADESDSLLPSLMIEDSYCDRLLKKFERTINGNQNHFLNMLRGTKQSLEEKGYDYKRHVLASLRELTVQLLRRLAPDHKVHKSFPDKTDQDIYYDKDGKPGITHNGRLLYIVKPMDSDYLARTLSSKQRYLSIIIKSTNKLHSSEIKMADYEIAHMILDTESLVAFILMCFFEQSK